MGGFMVIVVPVHPQKGESRALCSAMAQAGAGAFSYDEFGTACWSVYGASIPINPVVASVQQGAMITNINFNAATPPAIVNLETESSNWMTPMGYTDS